MVKTYQNLSPYINRRLKVAFLRLVFTFNLLHHRYFTACLQLLQVNFLPLICNLNRGGVQRRPHTCLCHNSVLIQLKQVLGILYILRFSHLHQLFRSELWIDGLWCFPTSKPKQARQQISFRLSVWHLCGPSANLILNWEETFLLWSHRIFLSS